MHKELIALIKGAENLLPAPESWKTMKPDPENKQEEKLAPDNFLEGSSVVIREEIELLKKWLGESTEVLRK